MTSSNGQASRDARAAQVAENIGDGNSITVADYNAMDYDHRAQLHTINPAKYAELSKAAQPKGFGK